MKFANGMSLRNFMSPIETIVLSTSRLEIASYISRGISGKDPEIWTITCPEPIKILAMDQHECVCYMSVTSTNTDKIAHIDN